MAGAPGERSDWFVPERETEQASELARQLGVSPVTAHLLVRKGAQPANVIPTPDSAYRYLALGLQTLDRTPWPCSGGQCTEMLQRAESHFTRSLELLPHLGKACFGLAQVKAMQGRIDEAEQSMRRCDTIYPFPSRRRAFDELVGRIESMREANR